MANLLEWLIDQWLRIRPPKIQRTAGFVVFSGISLLLLSFNEIAFEYVLRPIGFTQQGVLAPTFGLILVVIGLSTFVIDRLSSRMPSKVFQQDQALYLKISNMIEWHRIDAFLNHIFNHWYRSQDIDPFFELKYFLEDERNAFVISEMRKALDNFHKELETLLRFVGMKFYVDDGRVDRFHFLPSMSPDRTGQDNPEFYKQQQELNKAIHRFEAAYKKFIAAGRKMGMAATKQVE